MKLNVGCGGNLIPGWDNHDADLNICRPLPFADYSVESILAEHVFEHISTPDGFRFLLECKRILIGQGWLRLCIPVLDRLSPDHARDIIVGHGHLAAYTLDSIHKVVSLAGFSQCLWNVDLNKEIDGHWRVIGEEKDALETERIICIK